MLDAGVIIKAALCDYRDGSIKDRINFDVVEISADKPKQIEVFPGRRYRLQEDRSVMSHSHIYDMFPAVYLRNW